jgi:ribonuclease HII
LDECYNFKKNKGYGTKAHMDGIRQHGVTTYHRRSFHPVSDY